LSLVKFISRAPWIPPGAIVAILSRRKRECATAAKYRDFKKCASAAPGDLWNGSKSVNLSEDRTVVLTIFLARLLQAENSATRIGDRRTQATAMMRLTVEKDRKKHAA
jgi:hypothetical protein